VTTRFAVAATALALLIATPAQADVALENAWMRPAHAGDRAAVYVDIAARSAVKLVAATTPAAARVEFVLVPAPEDTPAKERIVGEVPVVAGSTVRFAYGGSHLRLVDLKEDARPGSSLPLTLTFADPRGQRRGVDVQVVVRGIAARRPEPTPADAAPAR
jgi:copper(I)-binding protein